MLTSGEQQELCQIEETLRDTDGGFARQLAMLQGLLRWAGPGRRAYLPVLAVLAAALLRLAAAGGRLLLAFAEGGMFMGPAALTFLGDAGWPGWEPGQASRHRGGPAQGRPRPDGPTASGRAA